jgi:hypothetical protein
MMNISYFSVILLMLCISTLNNASAETIKCTRAVTDVFDLIFVSDDNSETDQKTYMKDAYMPWLAVKFSNAKGSPLSKFSGRNIPCLVLLDAQGNVLAHSYKGETYVGPSSVIDAFKEKLATLKS